MIISAAAAIENNQDKLNDLNVFPVPDGDTGSNMALTVGAAARALENCSLDSVGDICDTAAKSMLKGARGNSGVITSLLFRGMASELRGVDECTPEMFARALQSGVAGAYKAVASPAEGTILTVARLAAEAAVKSAQKGDMGVLFADTVACAKEALEQTRTMNPVLQKAGVVDAGGYGWVLILEAMSASYDGNDTARSSKAAVRALDFADFSDFTDEDITFTYCTEFIVSRSNTNDPSVLKSALEALGDSLVLVDDDEIIKVHVHTDDPGAVLHLALDYGQFVSVKVENMRLQHSNKVIEEAAPEVQEVLDDYGVVAVSPGEGISEVFESLGVDVCVSGGQTMNPSTEDILNAINKVKARCVIVLPNNKNIILAAEQAKALAEKDVIVIPSKTVPQGVSAMQFYDTDLEVGELANAMESAIEGVDTVQLTTAVRDSDMNGLSIKKDDYIALYNGELIAGSDNEVELVDMLVARLGEGERDIITIYYGADIDEDAAEKVYEKFAARFTDDNVSIIAGGQSVYRYIISAE